MTAMEGKSFPTNIAITGTIMPDGSVGRVGGLPYKVMAARDTGMTQIIAPDCLRLEYDAEKNINVDIKQLSRVLGLRYIPVSSVSEAYAHLNNTVLPAIRTEDRIDIPDTLERHFRRVYEGYTSSLLSLIEKYPNDMSLTNDPIGVVATIVSMDAQSSQAASMGYYDIAAANQKTAFAQAVAYLSALQQLQNDDIGNEIDATVSNLLASCQDPLVMAKAARTAGLSTAGIQFMNDLADGRALGDYVHLITNVRDSLAYAISSPESNQSEEEIERSKDDLVVLEYTRLVLANLVDAYFSDYITNVINADIAADFPFAFHITPRSGAENLFYSTYLASQSTFTHSINAACQDAGIDPDQFLNEIIMGTPESAAAFSQFPGEGHEQLITADDSDKDFFSIILAQSYISSISQSSRLLMSVIELDPVSNADGSVSYSRSGLLHQLLRTARRRALDAVLSCRDKGLPWFGPAMTFRSADFSRDDNAVDKTVVLAMYWQAFLQANAMELFVVPDKDQPPTQKRLVHQGARVKELLPGCQPTLSALSPGDSIVEMDGARVRDIEDLRAMVSAIPKNRQYDVRYASAKDRKIYTAKAKGGQLLGILVEDANKIVSAAPR